MVLSTAQQLEIIERLETGRYQRGVGLSQFYEEFEKAAPSSNGWRKKQLLNDFKNMWMGATDIDEIEDYSSFPWYIKQIDKLIVYYDMYRKQIMNLAETRVDEEFYKHCPSDELMATLSKLGRYTALLEKFNGKNPLEKMGFFEPPIKSSKKSRKPVIYCNVDMQIGFIAAFYKIKDLMEALDHVRIPGVDKDWSKEFENLKIILENLEQRLEKMDALQNMSKDILEKVSRGVTRFQF